MGSNYKKENECFQKDYDKLFAKGSWSKEEVSVMKDYKKLIYYNTILEAMENGTEYPGSDYIPEMSFARGHSMPSRNPSDGRFMSGDYNGGWMNGRNGMYYDGMTMSGRRYYDSEKKKAIHELHHMMDNTDDAKRKSALEFAINMIESEQ